MIYRFRNSSENRLDSIYHEYRRLMARSGQNRSAGAFRAEAGHSRIFRRHLAGAVRLVAFLLLIGQVGLIAHRIEHYIAPDHMECGEDACTAFAPATGAPDLPVVHPPVFTAAFFLRFWPVRESLVQAVIDRIGFRAHAPPF